MRKRYKHGSSVIGSKVEKARWLLASNEPLACRVEVEAATDLLLRVLWARLPDVLPDDLSAELEAASAGGEIDPVAPSARQIMKLGSRIGLASMIESATRVGTVGLGWLFEYAADAGEGEDPRSRLETHLSALEMALDEVLAVLGDCFSLFVAVPGGPRGDGAGRDSAEPPRQTVLPLPDLTAEQRVEAWLRAQGRLGLFHSLSCFRGLRLAGRFAVNHLIAVGGQNAVFAATDTHVDGAAVAVKLARLDYDRPASFSHREVARAREGLRRSFDLLLDAPGRWFPRPVELVVAPNPLHSPLRPAWVREEELYLVEELVEGRTLYDEVGRRHHGARAVERPTEALAVGVVRRLLEAFLDIGQCEARLRYSDLSPRNVLIDADGEVRLVDSSSLVRTAPAEQVAWATRAFLPADALAAMDRGEAVALTDEMLVYGVGKLLHFALTNRESLAGVDPDWADPCFLACGKATRALAKQMCGGEIVGFEHAFMTASEAEESLAARRN